MEVLIYMEMIYSNECTMYIQQNILKIYGILSSFASIFLKPPDMDETFAVSEVIIEGVLKI